MHHQSLLKRTGLTLLSVLVAVSAHAEPNENIQQTITRTASQGQLLQAKLVKNAYRQEPYQDTYTVQVPYDVTETYYVDVPYQDQEAYTDYEDYYSNDYICRDYTEYEQRCRTVRECDNAPNVGIERAAVDDVIGRPRDPGADPGPAPYPGNGGGGPIRPDPRPPICRDRQVCESVPVTRQRCGYEQVRHQRAVTKYRTVTKYRSEARTRTVTRYRNEERCCVTRYHDVFDHQWGLDVQVQFPQGTELNSAEVEKFKIELIGSEAAPDIRMTPVSTVFGYKVANKTVERGLVTITLEQVARYKDEDLREKSLQNFTAVPTPAGLMYKFIDNAIYPRVASRHQLEVQDAITHEVVTQSEMRPHLQSQVNGDLAVNWDYTRNYEVVLRVHREGMVLENGVVDFEIRQPLQMILDMSALKDENRILPGISGSAENARVLIADNTVPYSTVSTRYYVTLIRKTVLGKNAVIAEKGFSRTSLTAGSDGAFAIKIADFGAKSSDIKSYLKSGSKVQVVVQVDRVTSDGQKIQFWKSANVEIR
ncbi:hypothetical protein [Bdellovibrio svalbardensis]|uniref:Bdellovibrio beta-sandwich domain-containing protein n=1 Tax=Bdellovibrio svalbardensis TaxID=2972972 RepID=A0ABT6DLX0_9BACT|nr:hypothetical protein [Bdellovibrio svalbardensis]MDG0817882.1 hypothetical protein [Bdellovibrio svalbardensis]